MDRYLFNRFLCWSASLPLWLTTLCCGQSVQAQPLSEQANTIRLLNGARPRISESAIATDATPSSQGFTIPSLWWQQQQLGDAINDRLIENWYAYDRTVSPVSHVDVVVNGQIWPLLNYLEQYAVITQFGESARSYGYQLRIFMGGRLAGLHVCDFASATITETSTCIVDLDYLGQGAIRGGRLR